MKIKLSIEEVKEIIKNKFNTDGDVKFIYEETLTPHGYLDGVREYKKGIELVGVEIEMMKFPRAD